MSTARTEPGQEDSPPADQAALLDRFHIELRQRNVSTFLWSTTLFDAAYLGWTALDYVLEPDRWKTFLAIRLSVAAFGTLLALAVRSSGRQHYTWEAFWVWLFACGAGIAAMLPMVEESALSYVLGFSLVLYGAGLLPFWRPAWAVTNVLAILVTAPLALVLWPPGASPQDLLTGLFFLLTGAGASVAMASFKYGLARRDFMTRSELATTSGRLSSALERLEAHDRLKNRFFANISHELRSPLTLILAPVQAMLDGDSADCSPRDLRAVEQNAVRLLRLIDDLLDLSRLDAGGLRLRLSVFDLGDLVRASVERCLPAAERQGLSLQAQLPPDQPKILGDEHRIEIVVANLLSNAIKYTPAGGRIQVRVLEAPDALRVEVEDDGPGIPSDEVEQVFDRFFQSEHAERRRVGGVGIGLALAKELVELHGGRMDLKSTLGRGSTFAFDVPLGRDHIRQEVIDRRGSVAERRTTQRPGAGPGRRETDLPPPAFIDGIAQSPVPAQPQGVAAPGRDSRHRARVLLAEDQEDLRQFIARLLGDDYDVIECVDGDDAWERVRVERPDLVLTDVMMPGRSGTALCRDIKSDPELLGIPVILLTARAGSDATLRAYAVGADDFVSKPFHPRVLVARVAAQLKLRNLSAELAQRQRLAAVGTLAAGILHEVRNPVNALLSATRTLRQGNPSDATRDKLLAVLQDGAERIHGLTGSLDAHVRPAETGGPPLCDLRVGMDATLDLMAHRTGGVVVHRDYVGERPAAVQAGPINQVFLNLVDNALKAGARNIWIGIDATGDPLQVTFGDDGQGIPPEVLQRIFDPFFTTARHGEGTGLGLFLSSQIVSGIGGSIHAGPRDGGGALFRVELPGEALPGVPQPADRG